MSSSRRSDGPDLPDQHTPGRYRIGIVCLGNICRSPMADVVLTERIDEAGLGDRVEVVSAGTGDWHVGGPMDDRAAATLTAAGYDPSRHRARQVGRTWLSEFDLVLAMDRSNRAALAPLVDDPLEHRLRMFRDFDPDDPGGDVPDPYYGGPEGFREVLGMVERTCAALAEALRAHLDGKGRRR